MSPELEIWRRGEHGYNLRRVVVRDGRAVYQRFNPNPPIEWMDSNEYDVGPIITAVYEAGFAAGVEAAEQDFSKRVMRGPE